MKHLDFTGQVLDGKYQMTRELGKGGMGTVYLATHLGTERPVAVKIIAPQFMQRAEFVERFRREARAAGRLRHPNVVDVTDFGFASTKDGQVAYLVMEYLDGCTLGEILDEEKNLPVAWTLDILEQVCSAVNEAHEQGIIHRDLKPDNIWLEPNQRGGYTVKVLDFGIAKLEEHEGDNFATGENMIGADLKFTGTARTTFAGDAATIAQTFEDGTMIATDNATISLKPITDEKATAIYDPSDDQESVGTKVLSHEVSEEVKVSGQRTTGNSLIDSPTTSGLTRVGAVLGTPLYMSPEQCRGEHLDTRSDIYSLGVIAYQMLSGKTPFEGDFKDVMESHKNVKPRPLVAQKVRRKMKRAIHLALDKDPANRPQTAEGFASVLRAREEGIFGLVSKALIIYSQHLSKFLALTTFLFIPPAMFTIALVIVASLKVSDSISDSSSTLLNTLLGVGLTLSNAFCGSLIIGTIAWIVSQYIAIPLRPVRLRPVLREALKKWKRFAGAGAISAILPFLFAIVGAIVGALLFALILGILYPLTGSVGAIFAASVAGAGIGGVIGFFGAYTTYMLVAPTVMMENVKIREAFGRSRMLVRRSFATAAGTAILMFLIPMITVGSISYVVNVSAKAFDKPPAKTESVGSAENRPVEPVAADAENAAEPAFNWNFDGRRVKVGKDMDMRTRVKETILESLINILWLPMQIFVFSFSGILVALLYLKTRLAGGESMHELVDRFEDDEKSRKKWQERVRQRLIQSGRITSKS